MFALIIISVIITCLVLCIIYLLYKNFDLERDNMKLSKQTNDLLKENSKLRKELL